MSTRPASHAGSWYSADASSLSKLIFGLISKAPPTKKGARVLVGPHAGYTYCGERLAETYSVWDCAGTNTVFLLGPSHHVYFRDTAMLSAFERYETPLGDLQVDTAVCERLADASGLRKSPFKYMSAAIDEDEHSFEMHAPFLLAKCQADEVPVPKIVPIMISALSSSARSAVVSALAPFLADSSNTFVVSSDFCHWGRRFGYTEYAPALDLDELTSYGSASDQTTPIYKSIEHLDRTAMSVAAGGSAKAWDAYIEQTGNTICGQKPLAIVLCLIEHFRNNGGSTKSSTVFEWVGYSQSSKAKRGSDSSVSYASGYVRLD